MRYVSRFTKVVIFRAVRSVRNCQLLPPLLLKGAIACALWCLKVRLRLTWRLVYYGRSIPLICCPGLIGEQIHRPFIVRALYPAVSLCFVSVVTVAGNYWRWKKEGASCRRVLYPLFHPSPAAQRVFAHELGSSSIMLCCICRRGGLQRGRKQSGVSQSSVM